MQKDGACIGGNGGGRGIGRHLLGSQRRWTDRQIENQAGRKNRPKQHVTQHITSGGARNNRKIPRLRAVGNACFVKVESFGSGKASDVTCRTIYPTVRTRKYCVCFVRSS